MPDSSRKLIYNVATTLDGFIAGPGGALDLFVFEGDHVADYVATLRTYGAVIMGRSTYALGLDRGVTDPYPFLETYVVSRTMKHSPDPRVRVIAGDVAAFVRELKRAPGGDVYLCGGGDLASTLFADDLVDEVVVKLNPVLAGGGTPLVAQLAAPQKLVLASTKVYQSGVITLRYAVARS